MIVHAFVHVSPWAWQNSSQEIEAPLYVLRETWHWVGPLTQRLMTSPVLPDRTMPCVMPPPVHAGGGGGAGGEGGAEGVMPTYLRMSLAIAEVSERLSPLAVTKSAARMCPEQVSLPSPRLEQLNSVIPGVRLFQAINDRWPVILNSLADSAVSSSRRPDDVA